MPAIITSPDDSRATLLALILGAKRSIKIYAQTVNDYKMVGALAKAAKKDVHIQLLTSMKMREKTS